MNRARTSADSTYDRENTAAYQRGAASFWESETKRTREKVAALERQNRELIGRLHDMDDLLESIHERLVNAGHHDCENCMGTGGVAEIHDVISKDGWDISDSITIAWSAPSDEACGDCDGTGIRFR